MAGRICGGCGFCSDGGAAFCGGCARPLGATARPVGPPGGPDRVGDGGRPGTPPAGDRSQEARAKAEHRRITGYYLIGLLIGGVLTVVLYFWLESRPRVMTNSEQAVLNSNEAARNGERARAAARAAATAAPLPAQGAPGDGGRAEAGVGGALQAGGSAWAAAGDPALPVALTRQDILRVVAVGAASFRKCSVAAGWGGVGRSARVSVLIGGRGAVEEAQALGAEAGTPGGACLEAQVRRLRFPPFSGEPMRIELPFAL